MLCLEPKTSEVIILKDCGSGRIIVRIQPYLDSGKMRLAFDIPDFIYVHREKVTNGNEEKNEEKSEEKNC